MRRTGSPRSTSALARSDLAKSALGIVLVAACATPTDSPSAPHLTAADSVVAAWVAERRIPGAVLLVIENGQVVHERAHGLARTEPEPVPMRTETVFDLASVTKVMATTMAMMLLVDRGEVNVDDPVQTYLPDFTGGGKEQITLRQLLTHRAGLFQWQPTYYHAASSDSAYAWVRDLPLNWPVGAERHYSDLGFMVLGRVVEAVSGQPLDRFVEMQIYSPLGLSRTGFRPLDERAQPPAPGTFAATSHGNPFERRMVHDPDFGYRIEGDPYAWDRWRTHWLDGEVNDGNAHHAFGGVAGHAGLFSTARELGTLLQLLLDGGVSDSGDAFVGADVVARFLEPTGDGQALGWQLPGYAPRGAFGHTGFTGTFVLGVPDMRLGVVLLTNRQNFGVDDDTSYPDVAPLQRAVTAAVTGSR